MEKQLIKNVTIFLLSLGLIICTISIYVLLTKLSTNKYSGVSFIHTPLNQIVFDTPINKIPPGLGSKPEKDVVPNIAAYRQIHPQEEGYGVFYDSSDIAYYAREIFPKLVDAQEKYITSQGQSYDKDTYKWRIGFYWVLNKDADGNTKYDYCMVPILVNPEDPKDRKYEYFLSGDKLYNHDPTITLRRRNLPHNAPPDSASRGNIFNTGTMFP